MKIGIKNVIIAVIWYVVIIALAIALWIGNTLAFAYSSIISETLGHDESKLEQLDSDEEIDSEYFKSEFSTDEELHEAGLALCEELESEGMTLLMNDGGLPLGSSKKVSLFGMTSTNPVYGGTGSGSIDTSIAIDPYTAFTSVGYDVNPTLNEFNQEMDGTYARSSASIEANAEPDYIVNECPVEEYTSDVISSFAEYNDAAIVFIGRSGGEGSDLSQTNSESGSEGYLAITENELDMIELANDNFSTVIIIVNSSNPVELGWMENYSNIKAALWVGSVGTTGFTAVAKAFTGEYNPSGRLVDTYAADSHSSPATVNFGSFSYVNEDALSDLGESYFGSYQYTGKNYVVYQEGIYVGYRYYETRYEDAVLGQGDASSSAGVYASSGTWDYSSEVIYPFGYGLSYTTFEYSDFSAEVNRDGDIEVTVTVTNTGDVAGKEVVQVYMQSPYTEYDKENNIEKASIELVAFDKTEELAAGATETLTIVVDETELRTYDAYGKGTYIQDGGTYYFAVGTNAHDALNNVLAAKGRTTANGMDYNGNSALVEDIDFEQDFEKFSEDPDTGTEIVNQFEGAEISAYYDNIDYLSRSDWDDTYPQAVTLTATEELMADLRLTADDFIDAVDESEYEMPTMGADNGLVAVTLRGADYDDSHWDDLLDQMTAEEMMTLVSLGGYRTQAVESIAYPGTVDRDGPQGISGTLVSGASGMAYTSEVVIASTWNVELIERVGELVGEDGLHVQRSDDGRGLVGWYAPAMNIHRTPFTGRSFEYFSEDGFLSGKMGAAMVRGARSKGMMTYIKHFAINDQDTNRKGLATFASEQSIREIYLTPFEISVKEGGSNAVMTSHNRIGAIWAAGSENLNVNVLRDEWGFVGHVVTDYVGTPVYQNTAQAVISGNDMMLSTNTASYTTLEAYEDNAYVMTKVREACHNILYSGVNSAAMNGIDQNTRVVRITPLWQYWLITLDVVLGVVFVGGIALTTYLNFFRKPKKK